jgi:hypothetical protein
MFREIITVYSEKNKKYINTWSGELEKYFNVEENGRYNN